MTKIPPRRTSVALLLVTSLIIFTACLHLVSTHTFESASLSPNGHTQLQRPSFSLQRPSNSSAKVEEHEDVLFDGVRRFVRTSDHSKPDLIVMVLTKDRTSWGQETFKPTRTFYDFLSLLNSTELDLNRVSLGMMTSSQDEYSLYKEATANTLIPRVTLLYRESEDEHDPNWWTSVPRGGRHTHGIQISRRMHVAALRNTLMARALHDEQHIVWIDSDIEYLSPGIVQTMLNHSASCEDAGIITARCQMGWNPDYDANSWAGARYRNPASGKTADPATIQDEDRKTRKGVSTLIKGTSDTDIVQLDSVGGTLLYVRASLVHQGLTFPPYNVIGTGWGKDGWDGLETEGMCYVGRYLKGGGCFVLGGNHNVQHTNN